MCAFDVYIFETAFLALSTSFAKMIQVSLSFFFTASFSDRFTFSSSRWMAAGTTRRSSASQRHLRLPTSDLPIELIALLPQLVGPLVHLRCQSTVLRTSRQVRFKATVHTISLGLLSGVLPNKPIAIRFRTCTH